ncbi:MAG: rod shape-determining protein MreC [bacterium]|nr:rod shape-determining protein MreC [bacterium]MBU1917502.1 rod shape-determining protein MreC [bacterium]
MKKKSLFILGICVLVLLLHFSFGEKDLQNRKFINHDIVSYVYRPVLTTLHTIKNFFLGVVDEYFLLVNAKKDNNELRTTLKLMAMQNHSLQHELRKIRDDELIHDKYEFLGYKLLPVNVMGFDPFIISKTISIDAGTDQGIEKNDVLVSHQGLVGRVLQVFPQSSKILLLIDKYFAIDVISTRTNTRCLVKGISLSKLRVHHLPFLSHIEFLNQEQAIAEGDTLITSGASDIFPGGISVGTVVDVKLDDEDFYKDGYVLPAVDFTELNRIYVLKQNK